MGTVVVDILVGTFALVGGFFVSQKFLNKSGVFDFEKKRKESDELMEQAKLEAEVIKKEAHDYAQKRRTLIEEEKKNKEERLKKLEEILANKESSLSRREEKNNELKLEIASLKEWIQATEGKSKSMEQNFLDKLSDKTGTSASDIKADILDRQEKELEMENMGKLASIEEKVKEDAEKNAKKIIICTIQRLCSPTSVETRAVHVSVPRDEVKGKIVGREGRNIAEFEKLLDVDIVFNDLPNTISLSAFSLVNRRIAQKAMEKLVRVRGDINKEVIHRAVKSAESETDDELYEIGKKALERMGIKNPDKEFTRIVGRLHYRTSYGQNIMKHSMEVGWVATMLGSELGLNIETCRVGGFLHDLGKAIDQDPNVKDAHDQLSKELMEKYGFSWEEVHAAWTHHDAIPQETPEALIVKAADAISAGRPGARQESIEKYIQRVRALQETAEGFSGVKKAFAISGGREVRVYVDPEKIQDTGVYELAKNVAHKIEEDITYPGKIKVNVIRRTKFTELAN